MKKLLFAFPIAALLTAGCNSSQQNINQNPVQAPVTQNTSKAPAPQTPTAFNNDVSFIINKGFLVPTQSASSTYSNLTFLNAFDAAQYYPDKDIATFGYAATYEGMPFSIVIKESDNTRQAVNNMAVFIKASCLQNENIGDSVVISRCPGRSYPYAHFMKDGHRIIVSDSDVASNTPNAPQDILKANGIPDSVLLDLARSFK